MGILPSGVLDSQQFILYAFVNEDIKDYQFRSGCGCVSLYWDSTYTLNHPHITFIYNSSGNDGKITRYGVVYLTKKDFTIDSVRLSIETIVHKTKVDRPTLKNQYDTAIAFETTTHDFDTLVEGEHGRWRFKFKNNGPVPITIYDAASSCGCVVPNYSKEPILPGEESEISVEFNSSGKIGLFNKSVIVRFTNGQTITLTISGEVIPNRKK
ncbi:MAG: DUF1573 domain-containing protein [Bacteroidia bacterium]|nr:DUF1573 domain-containing protein [Bacteroidia bacterium]